MDEGAAGGGTPARFEADAPIYAPLLLFVAAGILSFTLLVGTL